MDGVANATTATQLAYLGVKHLRTNGTSTSAQLLQAGANGAKVDVITPIYLGTQSAVTTSTLQTLLSTVIDPAASVIENVEGPNEVNVDPDSFNGLTAGPPSIEAIQQSLYDLVKRDPVLAGLPTPVAVYNFSVLTGTNPNTYGGMQNYADFNNVHAYGWPGVQPDVFLAYAKSQMTIAGFKPFVLTEVGAETMTGNGVDQENQAEFEIAALLDSWQLGFQRTYLFNVEDFEPETDRTNFSGHYGVYTFTGAKKLAARALHNFTSILASRHGNVPGSLVLPQILPFAISGQFFYYTNYQYLQKPNGFSLVLWNEPNDWNTAENKPISITSNALTLTLTSAASSIAVYDPLVSRKPLVQLHNASTAAVTLNTHPLILDVAF